MSELVLINDQPISATFFGEGKWLTEFVTPNSLEVQKLHEILTSGVVSVRDKLAALHSWVGYQVKYVPFVHAKIWIEGECSVQDDYWAQPADVIKTRIGNCANKSFLLASLIRNTLPLEQVEVILSFV